MCLTYFYRLKVKYLLRASQVTIILYLTVVGALLLYMLFLLLVDPLIRKRDLYTQPLHNEEEAEVRRQEIKLRRWPCSKMGLFMSERFYVILDGCMMDALMF